jgi:GTPase SAR1 family protein
MKTSFTKFITNFFKSLFGKRKQIKLGVYGPVNAGKTTLANKICKDWIGEELGAVSKIPHETREIQMKEKLRLNLILKSLILTL